MTMVILTMLFFAVQLIFGISLFCFKHPEDINEMSTATEGSATHRTEKKTAIAETITNTS